MLLKEESKIKWFYKQVDIDGAKSLADQCDELGQDGWELVGLIKAVLIFKKPEELQMTELVSSGVDNRMGWDPLQPAEEIITILPNALQSRSQWAHNDVAPDGRPVAVFRHLDTGRYIGIDNNGEYHLKDLRGKWQKTPRVAAIDAFMA